MFTAIQREGPACKVKIAGKKYTLLDAPKLAKSCAGFTILSPLVVSATYFSTKIAGEIQVISDASFKPLKDLTTRGPVKGRLTEAPLGNYPIFAFTD